MGSRVYAALTYRSRMKTFALLLIIPLTSSASVARFQEWENFKVQFSKQFKSLEHKLERKVVFESNLDLIEAHNLKYAQGFSTYTMGINQFSDMTFEEFSDTMLMRPQASDELKLEMDEGVETNVSSNTPTKYDWRDVVKPWPVKNQGSCGSCWAFSATGTVEAGWKIQGNDMESLSEQMLLDCGSGSCDGGSVDKAFQTMLNHHGACEENCYPYQPKHSHDCHIGGCKLIAQIKGYHRAKSDGVDSITVKSLYEHGPHAIHLYANSNFQHYKSGIFNDPNCPKGKVNHAMINVGWDNDKLYWILRNSWGASWGENGYMRIKSRQNICNCETHAWYVTF